MDDERAVVVGCGLRARGRDKRSSKKIARTEFEIVVQECTSERSVAVSHSTTLASAASPPLSLNSALTSKVLITLLTPRIRNQQQDNRQDDIKQANCAT